MMLIRYKFFIRIHVRDDFVLFISLFYIASAVAQTRQVINNLLQFQSYRVNTRESAVGFVSSARSFCEVTLLIWRLIETQALARPPPLLPLQLRNGEHRKAFHGAAVKRESHHCDTSECLIELRSWGPDPVTRCPGVHLLPLRHLGHQCSPAGQVCVQRERQWYSKVVVCESATVRSSEEGQKSQRGWFLNKP